MVGATGNYATRELLAKGQPVRAFVHRADERSEQLRKLGAEIVVGDLRDIRVVRDAMRGVRRAYFTYPIIEGLLEATTVFAAAAREAALEAIVNMSQITARPDHPSPVARQHWLGERIFDWSGVGVTHLRPPFFLENLIRFAADTIRTGSRIYLPFGAGRHAPVGGNDLARVIVGVLLDPSPHRGKSYVPTGPRSLSMPEIASAVGRALGKPVQYVDLPVEKWGQVLAKLPALTPHSIEHLSRVAEAHQRGEFDAETDVVAQIGGAPPATVETFIAENRSAFGAG
jgi:uncharacterized protein YbjT (DUF2867 family)